MMSRHSNARGVRKDQSAGMPRDPLPQSGWKVLGIDLNSEHFRSALRTCRSRSGKKQVSSAPPRSARSSADAASSSRCSAARRRRGPSQHAHSEPSGLAVASRRMTGAPAEEQIDEPTGKFLRPCSDVAHFELLTYLSWAY